MCSISTSSIFTVIITWKRTIHPSIGSIHWDGMSFHSSSFIETHCLWEAFHLHRDAARAITDGKLIAANKRREHRNGIEFTAAPYVYVSGDRSSGNKAPNSGGRFFFLHPQGWQSPAREGVSFVGCISCKWSVLAASEHTHARVSSVLLNAIDFNR